MVPGSLDLLFFLLHPHSTFFFQLYLYVRKKPQGICLKGKRPTEISVLVHVKQMVILKHKPKSLRSFCHNINPAQYFLKNSLKNDLVSYICSAWSVTFLSLVSVSDNILPYHGIVGDGVEMDLKKLLVHHTALCSSVSYLTIWTDLFLKLTIYFKILVIEKDQYENLR